MNYTVITDIFGNKIITGDDNNNFLPFIIIHSTQPHLVLDRVEKEIDSVWRLISPTIMHILYYHRLNPTRFAPLGHIWLPKTTLPNKVIILLVNTDPTISKYSIDYAKMGTYNNMYVWKPINQRGYKSIGLLIASKKPALREVRSIHEDLVTFFRGKNITVGQNANMNEFNFLTRVGEKKLTIKRSSLLKNNDIIKILSKKSNKYVSGTEEDNIRLTERSPSNLQKINYTTQGELKIDNLCIGISTDKNITDNYVNLQECDDNDGQKWYPYRDSYISEYDQSCMTQRGNTLAKEKCDFERDDQKWLTMNEKTVVEDKLQNREDTWRTRRGKKVILIEPNNPWYINKKSTPIGIFKQKRTELNKKEYSDTAKFHSTFMMDTHKSHMGYGHSYEQRKGRPCLCLDDCHNTSESKKFPVLENFEPENNGKHGQYNANVNSKYIDFNVIACSLFLIVILLVLTKIYTNAQHNQSI
jgi:hypothetical protein